MTYYSKTYGVERTSGPNGETIVQVKDTKNNVAFSAEYSGEDLDSADFLKQIQAKAKGYVAMGSEIVGETDFKTMKESGPVVIYSEAIEDYSADGENGLPALNTSEQEKAVTFADFAREMKYKGLTSVVNDVGVFSGQDGSKSKGFLLLGQNESMAHIIKIHKIDGVEPKQGQLQSILNAVQSMSLSRGVAPGRKMAPPGPGM